jgi:hypothetical protein
MEKKVKTDEERKEQMGFFWIGVVIALVLLITTLCIAIVGDDVKKDIPPYEERIETYEVVSVYKYIVNDTNSYGGVIGTHVCYSFSYLDGETLKHEEKFRHVDKGLTQVTIGDKDIYIVDPYTNEKYLQLTSETLKLLTGTAD